MLHIKVKKLLGYADVKTTEIYTHYYNRIWMPRKARWIVWRRWND